eukprot:1838030-Pleurochrysis_carterae.AAC.2
MIVAIAALCRAERRDQRQDGRHGRDDQQNPSGNAQASVVKELTKKHERERAQAQQELCPAQESNKAVL